GAGKSTLIKLLAGGLPPGTGSRETAQDLNIGYFAQHQLDQLHPGHSAIEHLRQIDSAASEQSLRDYLGGFGFTGERADSPVAPFSGGEKARLVLALLVYQRPNLLLLDEPTNHLDLEMRHALSQALQEFEGAMVVVSHDRHLLRTTSDRLLLINGGAVDEFRGDLDDYPRWLAENRAEARAPQSDEGDKHHSAAAKRERKRLEAQRRGQLQPLRQAVERLDQKLERLGQRRLELEQALAAPELYEAASKERLKALLGDKAELDRALEQTETQWFDACEALETAQQALE
ncbi:MAG: ABC transporter ATP-binding protein, partial [Candidatus Sedimenticola endophacoides]